MMLFQIEFTVYSSIDFLSETASFRRTRVAITDSSVKKNKNISTANVWCAPVQTIIVTDRIFQKWGGGSRGVMVKARDYRIVVREFELQPRYYVHFQEVPVV